MSFISVDHVSCLRSESQATGACLSMCAWKNDDEIQHECHRGQAYMDNLDMGSEHRIVALPVDISDWPAKRPNRSIILVGLIARERFQYACFCPRRNTLFFSSVHYLQERCNFPKTTKHETFTHTDTV